MMKALEAIASLLLSNQARLLSDLWMTLALLCNRKKSLVSFPGAELDIPIGIHK
jgi:hypothetical protein